MNYGSYILIETLRSIRLKIIKLWKICVNYINVIFYMKKEARQFKL